MCGRYLIEIDEKELKEIIAEVEKSGDERSLQLSATFKGGEIFPGSIVPVITANNKVRFMTWGFPSIVNKSSHTPQGVISSRARPGIHHINARSETAATSKTFGEAMASRRCVVPASGYYEWKSLDKKNKTKYEITLPGRTPMYMAGIYSSDERFAVLTRAAAPAITEIHDRMPVILHKSLIHAWLNDSPEVMKEALTDLHFAPVSASEYYGSREPLFRQNGASITVNLSHHSGR